MTNMTDTTDLRALMDSGTAIAATARLLGELEGLADSDTNELDWNNGATRGALIVALEQLGERVESLGLAALKRHGVSA